MRTALTQRWERRVSIARQGAPWVVGLSNRYWNQDLQQRQLPVECRQDFADDGAFKSHSRGIAEPGRQSKNTQSSRNDTRWHSPDPNRTWPDHPPALPGPNDPLATGDAFLLRMPAMEVPGFHIECDP